MIIRDKPYHNHGLQRACCMPCRTNPGTGAKKPVRIAPNGLMVMSTCNLIQTGLVAFRPGPITACVA